MRRFLLAISALFCLSACDSTQSLAALKRATPAANIYSAALASQYQQYADEKEQNYEWWTSKYFADKGLLAAYGNEVFPEDPATWQNLPPSELDGFKEARAQLLALLPSARIAQPAEAASAVVAYDRWLVVASDKWDQAKIDDERDRFFTLVGKLKQPGEASASPTPVETTSTILYFPFDRAQLSGSAAIALQQLVDYVKAAGNISIIINGHTDRAGSDEYNLELSERRALYVRQAILDVGVPENKIQHYAFGESDPDVETDDGVEEPLNRRVEIYIE